MNTEGIIILDYRLVRAWREDWPSPDLSTASPMDLRYDPFVGDIVLRIGDADFSAPWGWVPLIDFAAALDLIVRKLPRTQEEGFDFTESGATLRFVLDGDLVTVTANYVWDRMSATTSYDELRKAATHFLDGLLSDLCNRHPDLERNPEIQRLLGSIRR